MRLRPFLLLLAACGTDNSIVREDVARILGATIATPDGGGTLGAVADSMKLAQGGLPVGFVSEPGGASGMHGTLEHSYMMIECRDVHDAIIPCSSTTDRAIILGGWSGEVRQPGLVVQTTRQGTWSFTNLQYWTPLVHGTSQNMSDAIVDGESYAVFSEETERMITPLHMMGGTLELALSVSRGDMPIEMTGTVAFDAVMTSAELTIDGDTYRVDLATGSLID